MAVSDPLVHETLFFEEMTSQRQFAGQMVCVFENNLPSEDFSELIEEDWYEDSALLLLLLTMDLMFLPRS